MLNIKPPDYKFCPLCGTILDILTEEAKKRKYSSICGWGDITVCPSSRLRAFDKKWKGLNGSKSKKSIEGNVDISCWICRLERTSGGNFLPATSYFYKEEKLKVKLSIKIQKKIKLLNGQILKNPPKIGWSQHKEIMEKLQKGKN